MSAASSSLPTGSAQHQSSQSTSLGLSALAPEPRQTSSLVPSRRATVVGDLLARHDFGRAA